MLDIADTVLTILGSLLVAVFASGRIVGNLCTELRQMGKKVDVHAGELKELREADKQLGGRLGVLENNINSNLSAIRQSVAVLENAHLSQDGTLAQQAQKLDNMSRCLGEVKGSVDYMRGVMDMMDLPIKKKARTK